MQFTSVNEIDKLSFDDCELSSVKLGTNLVMEVEALIIKANNSQNTNYTDSYSDTTELIFENAEIISVKKEGYREYDALDRIVNIVEDEPVSPEDYKELFKQFQHVYLFAATKNEDVYTLRVELPGTDEISPCTDSYELVIKASSFTASWDKYLNRVQQ